MKEFFGKEIFESRPKAGPPPWRTKRRPLQKQLASYAKPARTDFQQIYKVETSQINNNFVMTAACDDILDREKLAVHLQGKQACHQITQIDSGGDEIDTTSNTNRLLPQ